MGSALNRRLCPGRNGRATVSRNIFVTRNADPEALERLQNSVARVQLYAGEPLRPDKLIGEGQSFMATILPSGKRAVATQISASTSAGGFILPV